MWATLLLGQAILWGLLFDALSLEKPRRMLLSQAVLLVMLMRVTQYAFSGDWFAFVLYAMCVTVAAALVKSLREDPKLWSR